VGGARAAEPARSPAPASKADPNLRHLIGQLEAHLMTRVRIESTGERGRIEIDYYGAEDLDRLARLVLEGRRT
jgi:ParB family chromosome partitioning protein